MRAIFLAIALGGTPIVGWVADTFGPRRALGAGAAAGFAAAIVGIYYLAQYRHLRLHFSAGRLRVSFDDRDPMIGPRPSDQLDRRIAGQ